MSPKFIFVTGGVLSSLGKGLSAASIGALLEARGLSVVLQKLDPYVNVDPGTMNPFQHGEVFVTDDGAETDLDLGHYERFTNARLGKKCNHTTGSIYYDVITKERRGDYLGGTVQIIPHITDEIKRCIHEVAQGVDLAIIEIGGTVGDIESLPFLEAIRQFRTDAGRENCLYIHLTLVPYIKTAGELKTKPTQHSVSELRRVGIQPDILLCRSEKPLNKGLKDKIALFCNVEPESVITAIDAETIYELPLNFHEQNLDEQICRKLNIWTRTPHLQNWEELVYKLKHPSHEVTIAMVGKYVDLRESYKSLNEALCHGGVANSAKVNILFIDSERVEREGVEIIGDVDGVLVPGGFGARGVEGKLKAVEMARVNKIPYFGICYGMHMAVIEFARNMLKWEEAHTAEIDPNSPYPVIYLMREWFDFRSQRIERRDESTDLGGSMRLGAYPCRLVEGTLAHKAYRVEEISERHRHRYEFNNQFRDKLVEAGLVISGLSPDGQLVEIVELADHPWFLGCQFHPEFKSRPMTPHPLFRDYIRAAVRYKNDKQG
ncbi:CTP synthase [Desulfarculus baarsii DSM 2075]|uniref:CTP synthase n=1 Tax=Desulfarculus baarsii (strain ATCC 33931 / DSM 2075 / LMG 7858 / VKM B-1802 / 2st14) TaxID=644282 RepID=E1QH00_DESB2|nr:CTP synthase [Desulfarculus baarsii]ADK84843.1 CTP synthase [Desulfarculus baarsii DSM 2075]